jgi:lysophospholipase
MLQPDLPLEKVIFAAPLVRVTGWSSKVWASGLLGNSRWPYPRWPLVSKGTVGDADYLRFQLQDDPLFVPEFSPHWIAALAEWSTWFEAQPPTMGAPPVVIWQGDTDDLVDWRHNLPVLERLFPGTRVQMFPGLSHTVLNESAARSVPVWQALQRELD